MNIHPALIPAFCGPGMYGDRVHQAVLDAGVKVTGCTVHFVDNEYDHGPIIWQQPVPVFDDDTADTLAKRVFEVEKEAYPHVLKLLAAGRIKLEDGRVTMLKAQRGERSRTARIRSIDRTRRPLSSRRAFPVRTSRQPASQAARSKCDISSRPMPRRRHAGSTSSQCTTGTVVAAPSRIASVTAPISRCLIQRPTIDADPRTIAAPPRFASISASKVCFASSVERRAFDRPSLDREVQATPQHHPALDIAHVNIQARRPRLAERSVVCENGELKSFNELYNHNGR